MCLWCCWKDLDEQDSRNLFGKIWIQNVRGIDFEAISVLKEKSVENMVTLGLTAEATLCA